MTFSLASFFASRNCVMPQIGLLQPADPFLDTAGEDLRRRIFITADQSGADLCLRPEFTIPVCLLHIAEGKGPARYAYEGPVFRQRRDEPHEFRQAGIEDLGNADRAAADAACLVDCLDALALLGVKNPPVLIGDQAVFEAVLAALDLPLAWRKRLIRAFGDPARLKADLARLSGETVDKDALAPEARRLVEARDGGGLAAWIGARMGAAGILSSGGRTPAEVAARLLEKAELADARLDAAHRAALEAFLSIDVNFAKAAARLSQLAKAHGLSIDLALNAFGARAEAIARSVKQIDRLRYRAGFGRQLDYYSGLVFEITLTGQPKPVAGGGRYDRLLTLLGAKTGIPAVGFSIWLDRAPYAGSGA